MSQFIVKAPDHVLFTQAKAKIKSNIKSLGTKKKMVENNRAGDWSPR